MGGVEVLQPQALLNHHHHLHHRNNHTHNNLNMKSQSLPRSHSGPAVASSSNRRKRSPPKTTPAQPMVKLSKTLPLRGKDTTKNHNNTDKPTTNLVFGQVKILKRDEVLPTSSAKLDVSPKEIKKEEPDVAPKNIRVSEFYAGSAFITSPEPSSLPMPAFLIKKKEDVLVDN